jgi:hypothetical protein
MHFACLVVGDDPERQLLPFSELLEEPRYKQFLDQSDVDLMAEEYAIPASDLQQLAARMPEWQKAEGGVEDGRLFFWDTGNRNGKYDFYQIGGRFDGRLQLKRARQPSAWRKLIGAKPQDRANQARKSEVVPEPILADPPAAVLMDGQWHECPLTLNQTELDAWRRRFAELFAAIPDDALLTVADLHS